jgi:GNAT superfamily N-acetyltransferase
MSQYSIRLARDEDSAEVARLAGQLGYPASGDAMRPRLERLLASSNDVVFVAALAEGGLVGWIHGVLSQFLESDYRVEIGGLVVDEWFYRKGVGRDLVERVESWALDRGAMQASVRCRTTRAEAHVFYERLGYGRAKTQIVFRKTLSKRPTKARP